MALNLPRKYFFPFVLDMWLHLYLKALILQRNHKETEPEKRRFILTNDISLSGEDGVLQLVRDHTELIIRRPVDSNGIIRSCTELFSNGGWVGSCEIQWRRLTDTISKIFPFSPEIRASDVWVCRYTVQQTFQQLFTNSSSNLDYQ